MTVDYQAKGSGAGIQDFINKTVDFAASDAAMTDERDRQGRRRRRAAADDRRRDRARLQPARQSGRASSCRATSIRRSSSARSPTGTIPRSPPPIRDIKLPDLPITVVRRSDSSGTTFVFTKHLGAISPTSTRRSGSGTTVQWPNSDKIVGAPKNDGVTATIKQTPGAIGYIEYGYAKLTKTPIARCCRTRPATSSRRAAKSGEAALAAAKSRPRPARLGRGPGGRRGLPDRHLHLDAVLQGAGRRQGRGAARDGRVLR